VKYVIYQAAGGTATFAPVFAVSAAETAFLAINLMATTPYCYHVTGVDVFGRESAPSPTVSAADASVQPATAEK